MKDKYITEKERYQIELLLKENYKPKQISNIIGKCLKTVYNEIHRGTVKLLNSDLIEYEMYCADVAQRKYLENCENKGRDYKIGNDIEFVKHVENMIIEKKYSPVAILSDIKNRNLSFETRVCFKTLYNWIDTGLFLHVTNKEPACQA